MTWNMNLDLNDPAVLRQIIVSLTDGVWNTSDTASFTDSDLEMINKIRDYKD